MRAYSVRASSSFRVFSKGSRACYRGGSLVPNARDFSRYPPVAELARRLARIKRFWILKDSARLGLSPYDLQQRSVLLLTNWFLITFPETKGRCSRFSKECRRDSHWVTCYYERGFLQRTRTRPFPRKNWTYRQKKQRAWRESNSGGKKVLCFKNWYRFLFIEAPCKLSLK